MKRNILKFIAATVLLGTLLGSPVFAQATGTVRGRVIDADSAEPVFGVSVVVREAKVFAQTDFDGKYSLKLPEGTHQVLFQMIGYAPVARTVTVKAGATADVNITLGVNTLDVVEVKDRALNNTEAAMLALQKKSGVVSDGITTEAIKKSPDSSAGDVLKRVTGVTLLGGKYVFVRGLGERYSNTNLNGSYLPSPEPDTRVVPMDLFPAGLIKNIRVMKTFAPEDSAEFSGGLVKIETIEYPDDFLLSFGMGLGYSRGVTDKHFYAYDGGGNDYLGLYKDPLGFGSKRHDMPAAMNALPHETLYAPESLGNKMPPAEFIKGGLLTMPNNWDAKKIRAPYDRSLNFTIGNAYDLSKLNEGARFGYVYGTSYSRSFNFQEVKKNRYMWASVTGNEYAKYFVPESVSAGTLLRQSKAKEYTDEVLWGHNLNFSADIASGQMLYWKNFYSVQSDSYVNMGDGFRAYQNEDLKFQTSGFINRAILSSVFGGKHGIKLASTWEPHVLEWAATYSEANRYAPDQKLQYWTRPGGQSIENFNPLYRRSGGGVDGNRFWSSTEDTLRMFRLSYEIPFSQWEGLKSKFKLGGEAIDREKHFRFRYLMMDVADRAKDLNYYPIGGNYAYHPYRMWNTVNSVKENNPGNPAYRAGQKVHAYFAQVDMPIIPGLRFLGGVRNERSHQWNYTHDPSKKFNAARAYEFNCGNVKKDFYYPLYQQANLCPMQDSGYGWLETNDLLPSVNLTYELTKDMNLRFGYSETITRPDLRELSQFVFQASYLDDATSGNNSLGRSYIHNYDVRYEWYMMKENYFGAGLFQKNISSPVEVAGQPYSDDNILYTWYNADKALVQGLELEYRREMLERLKLELNLFFIRSKVHAQEPVKHAMIVTGLLSGLKESSNMLSTIERPLFGQSPYVYNAKFTVYLNKAKTMEAGLFYNTFGERLVLVGTGGAPDVYEKPAEVWDVVYKWTPVENLDVKVTAKNITDTKFRKVQKDPVETAINDAAGKKILEGEKKFETYRKGSDLTLSASYKF